MLGKMSDADCLQATEGTSYKDPSFSSHYGGATNAGFIRGAYHFAHLDSSTGAAQVSTERGPLHFTSPFIPVLSLGKPADPRPRRPSTS